MLSLTLQVKVVHVLESLGVLLSQLFCGDIRRGGAFANKEGKAIFNSDLSFFRPAPTPTGMNILPCLYPISVHALELNRILTIRKLVIIF